jgi:hypothetical protein
MPQGTLGQLSWHLPSMQTVNKEDNIKHDAVDQSLRPICPTRLPQTTEQTLCMDHNSSAAHHHVRCLLAAQ